MKSLAIIAMTLAASTAHAAPCVTRAVVTNRIGVGSVHGTVDLIADQRVRLSDGTELAYQSSLPMPFGLGDHIGVTFHCDFKQTQACEVRIENAKREILVIAVFDGGDDFANGWRTRPGATAYTVKNEVFGTAVELQELVVSKGSTSVTIDFGSCTRVTDGGVDWLMAGAAFHRDDKKLHKSYSIQRARP